MREKKFLYFLVVVSLVILASITLSGASFSSDRFYSYYQKFLSFAVVKKDHLQSWLSGRFGASADVVELPEPKLEKVSYEIKSANDDLVEYVIPNDDDVLEMITITPGKSLAQKQAEAEAEAQRKAQEEERKKKQVQIEDTGEFCSDKNSRYVEIDLSSQRLALCTRGVTDGVFPISSGSRTYPTPTGNFQVNSKSLRAYSTKYDLYMPYWNSFIGNSYGIHELPEYPNGAKEGTNYLGRAVSHGCVRLGVGAAELVYNWAPVGTPVIVHQ